MTLQMLEAYFQKREESNLNQFLIRNQEALYEGRYTVKEEINRNIGEYLSRSFKYRLGIRTHILIKTKDDRILYPAQFRKDLMEARPESDFSELPMESLNYLEVAAENYRILNEGLIPTVDVQIKHNSWMSNSILVFYVFFAVLILQKFFKKTITETERRHVEQRRLSENLSEQLNQAEIRLGDVEAKENNYLRKISELKEDKESMSRDIDGLLEEMEKLEAGLVEQKGLKKETELEVSRLTDELDRLKEKLQKPRQKKKRVEATGKRFRVLYKNLVFTDRAVEGFLSLPDEFRIKAEEVVHKLNEDESMISVKRKVFGKKGKLNILEAAFSYSGRIYFQKDLLPKTRVLAIGTKNTQEKDLAFIESSG
jgi:hypothetical protein